MAILTLLSDLCRWCFRLHALSSLTSSDFLYFFTSLYPDIACGLPLISRPLNESHTPLSRNATR